MDSLHQQLIFTTAALLCAGVSSVHDIRECRIPNTLTGTAIVLGLSLHTISAGWQGLANSALAGFIAGGACLLFWIVGGMGAGDVKLMTAVGCIAGLAPLPSLLIGTAVAGAVFAIALSVHHGRLHETLCNVGTLLVHHGQSGLLPHPELNLGNSRALRLPFALPIAAGCLFSLCALLWGGGL